MWVLLQIVMTQSIVVASLQFFIGLFGFGGLEPWNTINFALQGLSSFQSSIFEAEYALYTTISIELV